MWPLRTPLASAALARSRCCMVIAACRRTTTSKSKQPCADCNVPSARAAPTTSAPSGPGAAAAVSEAGPAGAGGLAELPPRYDPAEVETSARYERWLPSFSPPVDDAAAGPQERCVVPAVCALGGAVPHTRSIPCTAAAAAPHAIAVRDRHRWSTSCTMWHDLLTRAPAHTRIAQGSQ
jgi:hypothetical protein